MRTLALLITLLIPQLAQASAGRTIDADALISSGHTSTVTLPAATGTATISSGYVQETPSGTVNGTNATFTLANTPGSSNTVELNQDGIILIQGTDYTISGATITTTTAPALGQKLRAMYSKY
jgi:hypothetical protein